MNNREFLSLIGAFINETEPIAPAQSDWPMIYQTAIIQNLVPDIAYINKKYALCKEEGINQELISALRNSIYIYTSRAHLFLNFSEKLTEQGIRHMPVKGWYLRDLYPAPELRTFGDIDLLIHKEDREKSDRLIQNWGYKRGSDWEPTYSYTKGMEYYEIHTNLMDGNLDNRENLQAYVDRAWEYAHVVSGCCYEPGKEFHFIYTLLHLAKHLYDAGAGLRMYMDVAFLIKHYGSEMDWNAIGDEFRRLKLSRFYNIVMNAVSDWFSVALPMDLPSVEQEILDDLADYTLHADLFGRGNDHSVTAIRNASVEKKASKSKVIIRKMFPPAEAIEERYTFVKDHRWMLPAAWVIRLAKNFGKVDWEMNSLKKIADTDETKVEKYDQFMRSLGL